MVSGHYQGQWPGLAQWQQVPPSEYKNYQELVRKAKLYDEMMKQPDCPDPKKEAWMAEFAKFMEDKYKLEPKP